MSLNPQTLADILDIPLDELSRRMGLDLNSGLRDLDLSALSTPNLDLSLPVFKDLVVLRLDNTGVGRIDENRALHLFHP